jgi:hypothetical protein
MPDERIQHAVEFEPTRPISEPVRTERTTIDDVVAALAEAKTHVASVPNTVGDRVPRLETAKVCAQAGLVSMRNLRHPDASHGETCLQHACVLVEAALSEIAALIDQVNTGRPVVLVGFAVYDLARACALVEAAQREPCGSVHVRSRGDFG